MENPNYLRKFLLDDVNIRGEMVRLTTSVMDICAIHHYPDVIQKYLHELCAASVLLTGLLKFQGTLTLQINAQGSLKYLVCKCTDALDFRALASWDKEALPRNFEEDILSGTLVVTIQNGKNPKPYQGIIPLNHQSIIHAIESYFVKSEQLDTKLVIDEQRTQVTGLLLQKLPQYSQEENGHWSQQEEKLASIPKDDLSTLDMIPLLEKYFADNEVRIFNERPVQFKCACSVQKMEEAIRLMGYQEAKEILQEKREIEVTCEFCNNTYSFNEANISNIFNQH